MITGNQAAVAQGDLSGVITDPSRLLAAPGNSNPWMPGTTPLSMPAPPNTMIQMAMAPNQILPGGWGTFDNIPDVNFVRSDLAVKGGVIRFWFKNPGTGETNAWHIWESQLTPLQEWQTFFEPLRESNT